MPYLNPGLVVQVDIEDNAKRVLEVIVILERFRGREQNAVVAVFPQQPLDAPERTWVVIDDKNDASVCQERSPVQLLKPGSLLRSQPCFTNRQ